jgi:hypothetical protein
MAVPSTTRSSPSSRVASPVTRLQCGLAARFFAFCSVDPAQAQDVVQDHRGQRGDARPAGRAHGGHPVRVGLREAVLHGLHTTGPAPGVLKRGSRSAVGIGGSSSALTVGTPATFRNPSLDASPPAAGVGRDLPRSHPPDVASSSNATSQRPAPAPFDRRRPRRRTGTRPGGDGGRGVPAGPHGGLGPRAGRTALQRPPTGLAQDRRDPRHRSRPVQLPVSRWDGLVRARELLHDETPIGCRSPLSP